MEETYQRIAKQVEKLRKEKGITKTALAKKLGVSVSFLTQFERHGYKMSAERIDEILDVLGYELAPVEKKTLLIST